MKIRPSLSPSLPSSRARIASAFSSTTIETVLLSPTAIPCSKRPRLSVEAISILERLSLFRGPFLYDLHKVIMYHFIPSSSKMSCLWTLPPYQCGDSLRVSPLQKIRYPIPLLRESPPPLFTLREELVTGAEM